MVNLNRQIRATQARQGGFSSHVLPGAVGYRPGLNDWGLAFVRKNVVNAATAGNAYAITGDGNVGSEATIAIDAGLSPNYIPVPVRGSTFLIAPVGIQQVGTNAGSSNAQIWQIDDSYSGGGDIVNYPGVLKTAFVVTREAVMTVATTQAFADQVARQFTDPVTPTTPPYPSPGYVQGDALVNVGGGSAPRYLGPFSGSGAAYGSNWGTLDAGDPDTWGVTAPNVASFTDYIESGSARMKNVASNAPLAAGYLVSDVLQDWLDDVSRIWSPAVCLPFGKDWTADLAALGVSI